MQTLGIADNDLFEETIKLFDEKRFCISVGKNSERDNVIAIRWYNFPKNSWCLISTDIDKAFLISLLTNEKADKTKILEVLKTKL
jgi:hypothetical protein